MSDLLFKRVRACLNTQHLFRPEALLLVAVSGGPDSLCLLHLLLGLRAAGGPMLHVAHLDHGARGAQSAAEAAAVAALAAAWGLPATVARHDVPALAAARRESLMTAARRARYAFLAATALATGAHAVAVAHQADDQAETVLLHTLRGTGLTGLRGMRPAVPWMEWSCGVARQFGSQAAREARPDCAGTQSAWLVRPLLTTSRSEIMAYCAAHDLHPTDDPSNYAPRFARTRIRRLLPILAAENPRLVAALARTARLCADDYDYIQRQLDAYWPALVTEGSGLLVLRRDVWEALHPALQRYALRRAAAYLGQPELSMEQVEAARALASRPGHQLNLGRTLSLIVDQIGLTIAGPASALYAGAPQLATAELPLACPGVTPLGAGWACHVGTHSPTTPHRWWVAIAPSALDGPLSLRCRRSGDRLRPVGAPGSRKLQDFFVDHKLPRTLRASWPLLVTPNAIVWVAGLRADTRFVAPLQHPAPLWVGLVRT